MPKGLPQLVKDNLDKSCQAAIASVEVYNRPGPRFRTAHYIILIVLAWTALLHAVFFKRGKKPWYKKKGKGGKGTRYQKIDGEPRHWDLAECLKEYFGATEPAERRNLEFLIGLRNKIEHRHLPHLDATLYGECQAALINFEATLVAEFGTKFALSEQLSVALQFSALLPDERTKAIKAAVKSAALPVTEYVEAFRNGLPGPILESMKYSFSVFLVPRVANRAHAADASVQFVKIDEASPEELERLKRLNVLIREKHIPIANLNLHKPGAVVSQLRARLPHALTIHHHTRAWNYFAVRPASGTGKGGKTNAQYCVYDQPHGDYLYTEAWIEKLAVELSDAARFEAITGHAPRQKAKPV